MVSSGDPGGDPVGDPVGDSVGAELADWLAEMPDGVDPEVEAARQRIGRLARLFEHVVSAAAADNDLTVGDLTALSVLRRGGPPYQRTPREIAVELALTSGTVSVRIERLVAAGLVEPAAATDGRSRPVRLTRAGHRKWRAATKARAAYERRLFTDGLTPAQLAGLNPALGALLARFEAEFGRGSRHDAVRAPE